VARAATIFIFSLMQILAAALALGAPGPARMDEPFEITADEIIYDAERNLYVADGNVRVVQGERNLRAAWVAFSTETRLGVAEGDVELLDAEDRLAAEFMVFNVDTLHGALFQGELDLGSQGFRVQARELVRTGENTFITREGYFTTCRCAESERVPWAIRAEKADVELGSYGTLTNSTFEVLGVPVLWVPWMFFPIKSERETGLLLPNFNFGGRGGIGVGLPFFWAAHPQLNVTLTANYFSQRGYKQDVELEYVIGQRSGGELFVAGLRDEQDEEAQRSDRWAVLWKHDQELPARWRWQSDLNLFSDNLYPTDFNEMRHFHSFRFVESTSNAARSFGDSGGFGAMLGARYADDIQGGTSLDRDDYLLQRWTELRGDVLPGTLRGPLGIDARLDSELIYFSGLESPDSEDLNSSNPRVPAPPPLRSNGRFFDYGFKGRFINQSTNGEGDGIFQPGEPLDERGARVVLHPRLTRPFQLGGVLEVVPEIGWQQTLYKTTAQQFADRGLLTARTDFRSRLVRDYQNGSGGVTRHIVEPKLSWALVSQQRQNKNPLFVPRGDVVQTRQRTLSLENVTRDPSDRIESANQVVLSLGQRFFSAPGPRAMPRLRADLVTAVDWNFSGGGGLGNLVAEGRLFWMGPFSARLRSTFDPESVAFEEGGAELSAVIARSDRFVRRAHLIVGYSYLADPPRFFETDLSNPSSFNQQGDTELNQLDFRVQVELAWRLRFTGSAIYNLVSNNKGVLQSGGLVEYVSKCRCWGFGVEIRHQKRDGFQGGFMIRFLGLGDERSNLFDGGLGAGLNL